MELKIEEFQLEGGFELELPAMYPARQKFARTKIEAQAIPALMHTESQRKQLATKIKPGMKIAVGVGSRGITNLQAIVKATITELKALGAEPFIVPAMGSHGAGKAEGQAKILAGYGITEAEVGAPVRASMETVYLGKAFGDVEVYFDRLAYEEAEGIIVIARIKPHTDFKGGIESGIMKMLGIGLGKHKGASYLHKGGMGDFAELIPAVGRHIIEHTPFLYGVGIIENSFHETAHIEIVLKDQLPGREKELLAEAKRLMPKLLCKEIDVLIVDEIGKNISGSGMDSNIIGRSSCNQSLVFDAPPINKIVVLNLTKETKGNASGIGLADYTTVRTVENIDFAALYANSTTAVEINGAKLPVMLATDQKAIVTAIRTAGRRKINDVKVVRIKNTLELDQILISENLVNEAAGHAQMEVGETAVSWTFDENGNLIK
ncbi:hypothetical protein [Halalkalibacter oceani]|uniref:hypothetical protein n=1 Tax=Halalkalibacter oceani TaxID=1653776 RepID=UPI003393E2B2